MQRRRLTRNTEQLRSKRVLVTGASAGLGAQLALAFAAKGATVIIVARRRQRLHTLCRRIKSSGGNGHVIAADLSCARDILRVSKEVKTRFGGVDVLLNNA